MKTITLRQYVQIGRTVTLAVDDDCDPKTAAAELDQMPLCIRPNDMQMPDHATVDIDWDYVSDMGIEDFDSGEAVLNNEA